MIGFLRSYLKFSFIFFYWFPQALVITYWDINILKIQVFPSTLHNSELEIHYFKVRAVENVL